MVKNTRCEEKSECIEKEDLATAPPSRLGEMVHVTFEMYDEIRDIVQCDVVRVEVYMIQVQSEMKI